MTSDAIKLWATIAILFSVEVSAGGEDFKSLSKRLKASMLTQSGEWYRKTYNNQKEANILVENYLESAIDNDDFEQNMDKIKSLITSGDQCHEDKCYKRGIFAKLKPKPSHNILMETLQRLSDLYYIVKHGYRCDLRTTYLLSRTNSIAMDPIGRRIRQESDLWPRIDDMVFKVAVEKAKKCIRECKENLEQLTVAPSDEDALLQSYWKQILEHRMQMANSDYARLERAYIDEPQGIEVFIDSIQHATVEQDEISIAQKIFKSRAGATPHDINNFLTRSCQNYLPRLLDIFESFDFDVQLQRLIPGVAISSVETDFLTNNVHRIYMKMCKKLINEREPSFLPLLEVGVHLPMDLD